MRELVWTRARVGPLEQTALIAQHFSWAEVRSAPCRRVGSAAVKTSPAKPVAELGRRVIGKLKLLIGPIHLAVTHVGNGCWAHAGDGGMGRVCAGHLV
jgi:hypothetical protein